MGRKIGVVLSYLLMIFEVLSTLLLTPFILRTLGQAEYGVFKLSAAVTAYMLLLDLGVGNAVTRYVAKFKVEGNIEQSRKFSVIHCCNNFNDCISVYTYRINWNTNFMGYESA